MSRISIGGGGGAITVASDNFFANDTARDNYFVSNPTKLKDNMYVTSNDILQKYVDGVWQDMSIAIKGSKGDKGDVGASVISANFFGDDLVFTKDDANEITLVNYKNDLKGSEGSSIVSASFVGDDMVFVKDDATNVTLTNAKIDLKGDPNPNALTADKLSTPRKINGVDFDGTQDITISTGDVASVNGQIGVVVLDTDDVAEGNNKYISQAQKDELHTHSNKAVIDLLSENLGELQYNGSPVSDLSNYYNKTESDGLLNNKVDKDGTKVLSDNNYTDSEKLKLANAFDKTVDTMDEITDGVGYVKYSTGEKTKLSNIEDNAQVNTVNSVNTKTGDVVLNNTDIGLGNVTNEAQIPLTQKGANDGVATLDTNGKIPSSQIPDTLLGKATYKGTWDASTNNPPLASGTGVNGDYYAVSVAGTTDLDGENVWNVGDIAIFNGTIWQRIESGNSVLSVNGKTGAVDLISSDISYDNVSSGLVSTNVKTALDELDVRRMNHGTGIVNIQPVATDNGDGSVDISASEVVIYSTSDFTGKSNKYSVAEKTGIILSDETVNYIIVNYNSGTPEYQVVSNVNTITESNIIPVFTIYREGTELQILDWDKIGDGKVDKLHQRLVKTQRFARESGLKLSYSLNLYFGISSGTIWYGANSIDIPSIDSSTITAGHCRKYYKSGGNWVSVSTGELENIYYQDTSTGELDTLSGGRYAVNWIYKDISNTDKTYFLIGQGNYRLVDAQASQPPQEVPNVVKNNSILVGRIIIEENEIVATQVDSAFDMTFSPSGVINHNDLSNIESAGTGVTVGHITDQTQTITGIKAFDTMLVAGNEATETWGSDYGVLKLGQNCSLASNKTTQGDMFLNQNMYWDGSWKRINDGVASSVIIGTNGSCKYFIDDTDLADTGVTLSNPVLTISNDKKLGIGTDVPEKKLHLKFEDNNGILAERLDTGINGLKTIAELRSTTTAEISTDVSDVSFGAYIDYFVDDSVLASPQKIGISGFSVDGDKGTSKFQIVPYKAGSPNLSGLFKVDCDGNVISRSGFEVSDTYTPSADGSDEKNVINQNSQLTLTEDYNITGVAKNILSQNVEILDTGTSTTAINLSLHGVEQHLVNNKEIPLGRFRGINSLIENNGGNIGYIDGVKSEIITGATSDVPNLYGGNFRIVNGGTAHDMKGIDIHLRNNGGTVTNMYGLSLSRVPFGYVSPTNSYGLHIEELGGSVNNFGIYQKGKCNNELQGTFKIGSYTTAEMNGLTAVVGMQVYNTDTSSLHIFNGTYWENQKVLNPYVTLSSVDTDITSSTAKGDAITFSYTEDNATEINDKGISLYAYNSSDELIWWYEDITFTTGNFSFPTIITAEVSYINFNVVWRDNKAQVYKGFETVRKDVI